MAECPFKTCRDSSDCTIIEIMKKTPVSASKCSYFKPIGKVEVVEEPRVRKPQKRKKLKETSL